MIRKRKKKNKSRKKKFVVYGRFITRGNEAEIESWTGTARSMKTVLRRAISELWRRDAVRWKHHSYVNFSCFLEEPKVEVKHGK